MIDINKHCHAFNPIDAFKMPQGMPIAMYPNTIGIAARNANCMSSLFGTMSDYNHFFIKRNALFAHRRLRACEARRHYDSFQQKAVFNGHNTQTTALIPHHRRRNKNALKNRNGIAVGHAGNVVYNRLHIVTL